jgi:imidazolonepropionase
MPGFVDCHTHVVFGGSRVEEFAGRLQGQDVQALSANGVPTGIIGTMTQTRDLSVDDLIDETLPRLREMLKSGTTTVESKSGYGLDTDSEIRILEAGRRLNDIQPVDIINTFLGAHAVPQDRPRRTYIEEIIGAMIPRIAAEDLAEACDVYCDDGYFTMEEAREILEAGVDRGLKPKIHLDAYSHTGAASLAEDLRCLSVDHLNFTLPDELRALGQVGSTGVLLPALELAAQHPHPVDARRVRENGVSIALATDMCPRCYLASMQFVINLACHLSHLTVAQAIQAVTLNAARAIGHAGEIGSLEPGKLADVIVLGIDRHEELGYRLGGNAVESVVKRGVAVVDGT